MVSIILADGRKLVYRDDEKIFVIREICDDDDDDQPADWPAVAEMRPAKWIHADEYIVLENPFEIARVEFATNWPAAPPKQVMSKSVQRRNAEQRRKK